MRTETFHTPGPVRLDLELPAGAIEPQTADTEETHVELEALAENGPARETNIQLVSGDVWVREAGESVRVNTVSGDHRLEAVVKGRMELRAISGDIMVGVRRGSRVFIDANTVSGSTTSEFELSDAPQQAAPADDAPLVEVFAKTVSGDVRLERAPAPAHA